jgi:hypothetical protein
VSKRDLALDLFRSYKTGFIKKSKPIQERTNTPGDPTLISEVISDLINQRPTSAILEARFADNQERARAARYLRLERLKYPSPTRNPHPRSENGAFATPMAFYG